MKFVPKVKTFKNSILNNLPIILSLIVVLISIFYNNGILSSETKILNQENELVLTHFGNQLKKSFVEVTEEIKGPFLYQWTNLNNFSEPFTFDWFNKFVPLIYSYYDTFYSISWINSSGIVNYSYPIQKLSPITGQNAFTESINKSSNDAFILSRNNNETTFSDSFSINNSKSGIESFIPLYNNGSLAGIFGIIFDVESVMNDIFTRNEIIKGFSIKVFDNNRQISVINGDFSLQNSYVLSNTIMIYNKELVIYSKPIDEMIIKISPYSMIPIFIFEIILCLITYYLTNILKTKNKVIESEYLEKDRMKEILFHKKKFEALGTLSGGIAHDFNNIITNMNGHLELISLDFVPKLNKNELEEEDINQFMDHVNELFKNTKRSQEITKQILIYSKQAQISMEYIELSQIIRHSIKFVQETNSKNIKFEFTQSVSAYVYTNETLIEQIFMNILINAVNAVKDLLEPLIIIKMEKIDEIPDKDSIKHFKSDYPNVIVLGSSCVINIIDNGKGMSNELIDKIMDPFHVITSSEKGTGLGLTIIQNNIALIGGKFKIESKENEYTKIEITLPLVKPKLNEVLKDKLTTNIESLNLKGLNICIIDDEIDIAQSYSKILTKYGAKAVYYTQSTEFLTFYQSNLNIFDILVIDYNMPEMNGLKLLLNIQMLNKDQNIILMTGYAGKELENVKIPLITKPFEVNKLIITIKNLLDLL